MGASHTTLSGMGSTGGIEERMPDLSVASFGAAGGGGTEVSAVNTSAGSAASTANVSNTGSSNAGDKQGNSSNSGCITRASELATLYNMESMLYPGSGRMMRTMTCRHKTNKSLMVLKSMWVSKEHEEDVDAAQKELLRIKQALKGHTSHVTPFLFWGVGDYRPPFAGQAQSNQIRPVYMVRPYFHTTLSDRLASRPFLTYVEKLWIIYQILQALDTMHTHKVVHGFLTTENIGLSSWNWVVLMDIASSHKARTSLPDDDPSEYLYYFQEMHTHHHTPYTTSNTGGAFSSSTSPAGTSNDATLAGSSTAKTSTKTSSSSREKRCYLAPERFYTPRLHPPSPSTTATSPPTSAGGSDQNRQPPEKQSGGTTTLPAGGTTKAAASTNASSTDDGNVVEDTTSTRRQLTPAMDIFSAGCVIMETFLNGERALDLGDLMEYRRNHTGNKGGGDSSGGLTPSLQQKLNKIEFSTLRAACRHMLHLDPNQRLSAKSYLERLQTTLLKEPSTGDSTETTSAKTVNKKDREQQQQQQPLIPTSFERVLAPMMERVTFCPTPDARLAVAVSYYDQIIWETVGIRDCDGSKYMEMVLGLTMIELEKKRRNEEQQRIQESGANGGANAKSEDPPISDSDADSDEKKTSEPSHMPSSADLFAETEALLKKLESLTFDGVVTPPATSSPSKNPALLPSKSRAASPDTSSETNKDVSPMSKNSLLIYLQLILSTIRHLQRPASKLVALQLIRKLARYSSDEARLQRIVPTAVSLLQDQDSLVRASSIQVLAYTLSIVETFPPSDSNVFPQYVFKRIAHMITDPSLVVRVAFAHCVPLLAETSHRFLDISHAVRLYETVGGGGGSGSAVSSKDKSTRGGNKIFTDDIAKLLGDSSGEPSKDAALDDSIASEAAAHSTSEAIASSAGKTLITSTYNSELAALHETVSRWVIHITTDQSEHSSPPKRALLGEMARLCNFFGLDGVMAFILPQILSFLNDRKDWQLRSTLFEVLPSVCQMIGRAATEHFVLPCLETALVDSEEPVICRALRCLSQLLDMGLLSRSILIGESADSSIGLLMKYGALLVHPSVDIRHFAIATVNAACTALGFPDGEVFIVPILRPYLRFEPSSHHLSTPDGLEKCLHPPWTRAKFQKELDRFLAISQNLSPTEGQWTSIGIQIHEGGQNSSNEQSSSSYVERTEQETNEPDIDLQTERVRSYLQLLGRGRARAMITVTEPEESKSGLHNAMEGSLKLARKIKFPRQDIAALPPGTLPSWYNTLRDAQEFQSGTGPDAAIRSVSALGQVYGLSVMEQSISPSSQARDMSRDEALTVLRSDESRVIRAACNGEWGSETCLDPTLTDTCLLVGKLNALRVPPLPPKLSDEKPLGQRLVAPQRSAGRDGPSSSSADWKPRIDTLVASSSTLPGLGHTAPIVRMAVSPDQRFFVSGSHDGTCRVWELEKADKCAGILESSITYSGHSEQAPGSGVSRINDLSMVEGSHSVVSGASDGSIHVWRVDMVSSGSTKSTTGTSDGAPTYERQRVAGSSEVRQLNPNEGEILAVNHFNSPSSSVLMFASQTGNVHSWDLRCSKEPFVLKSAQGCGYLTSMAIGSDRNWVVTGSSRGYLALWDVRFQQLLKLWHHSRGAPINRVATSFVPPPQSWTGRGTSSAGARPFVFVASGPNECSMFDIMNGACRQCFRSVDYSSRHSHAISEDLPRLNEVTPTSRRKSLVGGAPRRMGQTSTSSSSLGDVMSSSFLSVNAMVGSIGASDASFLITGGSDCRIRHWDFLSPHKCYVISGLDSIQPRPSFERIDYEQHCRLMQCRQAPTPAIESSRVPRKLFQGLKRPEYHHHDSIQDLKIIKSGLLSCSRDCTIKLWR